jgi:hypothetical protein
MLTSAIVPRWITASGPVVLCGVGFCVDYVAHIAIAYAESPSASRIEKTRNAVSSMGVSVTVGFISTAGASAFLLRLGTGTRSLRKLLGPAWKKRMRWKQRTALGRHALRRRAANCACTILIVCGAPMRSLYHCPTDEWYRTWKVPFQSGARRLRRPWAPPVPQSRCRGNPPSSPSREESVRRPQQHTRMSVCTRWPRNYSIHLAL